MKCKINLEINKLKGNSRLMVHAQKVKESLLRKRNMEAKKARYFGGGSSKSRLDM